MAGLQSRFLAMIEDSEDHQDATKVTQKRKRSDNDEGEDDSDKARGSDDNDDEEVDGQKYAWIGVEIPKPNGRNGNGNRSGFSKKNVCASMGIDEEKFHFIQVSDPHLSDCIF